MHIRMHRYWVANAHASNEQALGNHGGPSTLQTNHTLARSHCKLARKCFGSQWGMSTCKAITSARARFKPARSWFDGTESVLACKPIALAQ